MCNFKRICYVLLGLTAIASAGYAQSNPCGGKKAANPCNPCGGKGVTGGVIAVNPCHAKHGTVFYAADPMRRNTVTFTSKAPLEDIIGASNSISGYVTFDPQSPYVGVRGCFTVPVDSLDTGIPLRDEHLRSNSWLGAKGQANITFTIEGTKNVRLVKTSDAFQTYDMTLVGSLSLHKRDRQIEIPARVTFLKESRQTKLKMPGDLLAVRASFKVPLEDFGITGPAGMDLIGSKVGDTIAVDVSLFASSRAQEVRANPGNPCGGKVATAGNPCNPCGGKEQERKAQKPRNPCGGKQPLRR